jgi:PhoPQ-activated pathogenicity-related protein
VLTTHPSSAEVKEKSRAMPLITLCALMAGCELNFTFTFTFNVIKAAMASETSVFLDLQQQTKNKMCEQQNKKCQSTKQHRKKGGRQLIQLRNYLSLNHILRFCIMSKLLKT